MPTLQGSELRSRIQGALDRAAARLREAGLLLVTPLLPIGAGVVASMRCTHRCPCYDLLVMVYGWTCFIPVVVAVVASALFLALLLIGLDRRSHGHAILWGAVIIISIALSQFTIWSGDRDELQWPLDVLENWILG